MLLKGKPVADEIVAKVQNEKLPPLTLAVFHPLEDAAAETYLKTKEKWLKKIDAKLKVYSISKSTSLNDFLKLLDEANNDPQIHGIMVEMPFPIKSDSLNLSERISHLKDVDGVTFRNQGIFFSTNNEEIVPCTARAAITLLEYYKIPIAGRKVLVIGRSNIVGLPLFKLFLNRNGTPTVAHRKTQNLTELIKSADLIAICAGKRGIVRSSEVKEGAAVVDVGIHLLDDGKVAGDMDLSSLDEEKRISYSPVPGGVGVVTNAVLLDNLAKCYKLQSGAKTHD